ncbi:MAG: chemotaxis protein CheB [Marinicellaceae bacterium]
MNQKNTKDCVGLVHVGNREKSGIQIFEKLNQYDFPVIQWDVLDVQLELNDIDKVDVVIVNIGDVEFDYDQLLDYLFDNKSNIIINEALISNNYTGVKRQSWERHLLNKVDSNLSTLPDITKNETFDKMSVDLSEIGAKHVWILAASIGGPEALQEFLSEIGKVEGFVFIIIQHIDKEFLPLMAKQLSSASQIQLDVPVSGMKISVPTCLLYPVDEYIEFHKTGTIELVAQNEVFAFTPCIDATTEKLIKNINNINMAVFSGMSTDGIIAANLIKKAGGKVITQIESSCVLSSIVSGVKKLIQIDFEGTPKQMAQYIKNN